MIQETMVEARSRQWHRPWLICFYILLVAVLLLRGPSLDVPFDAFENDDAIRLVQIRDLLAGQHWQDLSQYRMGLGEGIQMHWSRLIDLPVAGLIWAASQVVEPQLAEHAAVIAWPLLVLIPFLWMLWRGGWFLGGAAVGYATLLLATGFIVAKAKFFAGSLDHHNVQMVCLAGAIVGLLGLDRTWLCGVLLGVAASVSLIVGLEAIPFIALTLLSAATLWALDPEIKPGILSFCASFAAVVGVHLFIAYPSGVETAFKCDTFDQGLGRVALIGAGVLFLLAGLSSHRSYAWRAIGLGVVGAIVMAASLILAPDCLKNPLDQLDPIVAQDWLGTVAESLPLHEFLMQGYSGAAAAIVLPLLALFASVTMTLNAHTRLSGVFFSVAILMGVALMFYQVRNEVFVLLVCLFPMGWAMGRFYAAYRAKGNLLSGLAALICLVLFSYPTWGLVYDYVAPRIAAPITSQAPVAPRAECPLYDDLAVLNDLSPTKVITGTNMAASVLLRTHHSVIASNFHRNNDGIKAVIDWGKSSPEEARAMMEIWGARLIVFCKSELADFEASPSGPNPMWQSLLAERLPIGFKRLSAPADALQILTVTN